MSLIASGQIESRDARATQAGPAFIQSLARGIDVIRSFDGSDKPLTLSEVAARTRLTRATARRFLLTLAELGYVRVDAGAFSLTARVLEIGYSYLSSASLPQLAEPRLEELSAQTHESASLSVLDEDSIVYIARVAVSRIMTVGITIGTRFPAYCTSMGRVLLAGLAEDELDAFLARVDLQPLTPYTVTDPAELGRCIAKTRRDGWALVDQELEEGLTSIAAPVRDRSGTVIAAVNVSLSARKRARKEAHDQVLPELLATTQRLEADLSRLGSVTRR